MSSLFDEYLPLYRELKELSDRYARAEQILAAESEAEIAARKRRIARMEEQLEKIGEYRKRVEKYLLFARKYVKSDVQAFVVPRELHFKRMYEWSQMIDPGEEDDPYAKRVVALALSNLLYLDRKQAEIEKAVAGLKNAKTGPSEEEIAEQKRTQGNLESDCMLLVGSDRFVAFAARLKTAHERFSDPVRLQRLTDAIPESGTAIGVGGYALPLPVLGAARGTVKSMLPDFFDESAGSVLMPVEQPLYGRSLLSVSCTPGREKRLYRALQNYLLNLISSWPVGENRIFVLDALHYNSTILGPLRPLAESAVLEEIPHDEEELTDVLRGIVSDFADMEETLGILDSVDEYNRKKNRGKRLPRTTLLLIGYPSAFSSEARDFVQRILLNAERYGVNIVAADTSAPGRSDRSLNALAALSSGTLNVRMLQESTLISLDGEEEQNFRWYELRSDLDERFVKDVKSRARETASKGNVYTDRVPLDRKPAYKRGMKQISLPYGVNSRDEVQNAVFNNENFAAFLMGASGSGKSTLLHTLITGILANYHPDDVELWLADFKMAEFAQYIDPMPPHVKYILLDESRELVYDLIDRLTEVMMERQRFFMQPEHRGDEKLVEKVGPAYHMPIIFVILDEFSIMSQKIKESDVYKLKLQNLLAKGRSLGIKFIFSSQSFASGVEGLSPTAKKQIQMRIAMKNSAEEKKETLELSSAEITEKVRGWIDALPPHFALSKHYNAEEEKNEVEKLKVLYFPGKGDEAMAPQRKLIERIRDTVKPVSAYDPGDPNCFLEKHPVVVDGNSYRAFNAVLCDREIAALRADGEYNGDEIFCYVGSPRLMRATREIVITPESRQNLLLIADSSERSCVCSVIASVMKCFERQGRKVEIWAYERDRIYRAMREGPWEKIPTVSEPAQLCDRIRQTKRAIIENAVEQETLIVLLGFENVCTDFDFVLSGNSNGLSVTKKTTESVRTGLMANGEADDETSARRRSQFKQLQLLDQEDEEEKQDNGNPIDDEDAFEKAFEEMLKAEQQKYQTLAAASEPAEEGKPADSRKASDREALEETGPDEQENIGVYNAKDDFAFCVRQGSRRGIHFLMQINSLSDLRMSGLKLEWFRHRLAFSQPTDDSRELFRNTDASRLTEHVCLYTDMLSQFSFRPYLHEGIGWDGWGVGADGKVIDPRGNG